MQRTTTSCIRLEHAVASGPARRQARRAGFPSSPAAPPTPGGIKFPTGGSNHMRLYAKLFVMIQIFAGIQYFAPPSAWGGEAWLLLRCLAADVSGDEKLAAQLVDEDYQQRQSIDNEVVNITLV